MALLLWFFGGVAVAYILWVTISYTWPVLLLLIGYGLWHAHHTYYYTDAGAHADVAYYCGVLGTDKTTQSWQEVYEYTLFDERHLDDTGATYYAQFRNMDCDTAIAQTEAGEYQVVEYKHRHLGYIRRYFYFRDGEVRSLYRDVDQFLWQRALFLRVGEGCNLDRDTKQCIPVPNDACSWNDITYKFQNDCLYDSGKGKLNVVLDANMIKQEIW